MKNDKTNNITTIKLLKETKERLDKLRGHKRETYDDILQELLSILNLARVSPEKAKAKLISIERKNRAEKKSQFTKKEI